MGLITIPLLPSDVNSLDHPDVVKYRLVYQQMAEAYQCRMTSFAIDHGVILVSFDSEELCNDIIADLKEMGLNITTTPTKAEFVKEADSMLNKARSDFERRN